MLRDTISSMKVKIQAVNLMEYVKGSPIHVSTKRVRTIIKTWTPLFMDVVVEMIQLVTTSWAEDIIQEWEGDTPMPTPTTMGMVLAMGIIKIKVSRDICSLLSPTVTVVVGVEEVIMEEDDTIIIIIMVPLHSLLDHQGIEVLHLHLPGHLDITVLHLQDHPVSIIVLLHLQDHLDIMALHHHHLQDLMDPVDIIGIMDHPHLDLDIIGLLPHHLDVVISNLHLHLDVVMGVDLCPHSVLHLLDMDQDNMDHLLSLQDQGIMDPHLPMVETIEDLAQKVLMEEVIVDRSESTGLVLVHPLLRRASARSMPTPVLMDRSTLDIKGMTM